jgi:hypothetical protein
LAYFFNITKVSETDNKSYDGDAIYYTLATLSSFFYIIVIIYYTAMIADMFARCSDVEFPIETAYDVEFKELSDATNDITGRVIGELEEYFASQLSNHSL